MKHAACSTECPCRPYSPETRSLARTSHPGAPATLCMSIEPCGCRRCRGWHPTGARWHPCSRRVGQRGTAAAARGVLGLSSRGVTNSNRMESERQKVRHVGSDAVSLRQRGARTGLFIVGGHGIYYNALNTLNYLPRQ
jgi:hypothetical protein